MFNLVTGEIGQGQAVLVRAIDFQNAKPAIGSGPGKLTRSLAIDRRHNRCDVTLATSALCVLPGPIASPPIARGPRIGVAYAGEWATRPWRFWWRGHAAVSQKVVRRTLPHVADRSGRRRP
jgi:DNA-3-methyladenine glycosylase